MEVVFPPVSPPVSQESSELREDWEDVMDVLGRRNSPPDRGSWGSWGALDDFCWGRDLDCGEKGDGREGVGEREKGGREGGEGRGRWE